MSSMKKYVLLTVVILFSCTKDDELPIIAACGVDNPVEDLNWLKTEINRRETNPSADMKYCSITLDQYENQVVFVYNDCNPVIDKIIPILNCDGEVLNNSESLLNLGERINRTIIWKPKNFVCGTN